MLTAERLPTLNVIAGAKFRAGGLALGIINIGPLRSRAAGEK